MPPPAQDCRPSRSWTAGLRPPRSVTDSSDSQAGCSLQTTRFLLRVPPRSPAFFRVPLRPPAFSRIFPRLSVPTGTERNQQTADYQQLAKHLFETSNKNHSRPNFFLFHLEQKEIGKYQIINILRSIILGLLETASREIGERRGCLAGCEPAGMATGGCQTRVERARRVSGRVRARGNGHWWLSDEG